MDPVEQHFMDALLERVEDSCSSAATSTQSNILKAHSDGLDWVFRGDSVDSNMLGFGGMLGHIETHPVYDVYDLLFRLVLGAKQGGKDHDSLTSPLSIFGFSDSSSSSSADEGDIPALEGTKSALVLPLRDEELSILPKAVEDSIMQWLKNKKE